MSTASPLTLATDPVVRARQLLDDALADRDRINRRIKRIRALVKAAEAGDDVPELDAMVDAMRRSQARVQPMPDTAPRTLEPLSPASAPPPPPRPAGPMAGLPPAPPGPTSLDSVDVGGLRSMDDARLDTLPYGVITLDHDGRIVGYNDTESRMVGLPKDRVLGRGFFGDVAPCTKVKAFEGRFRDFVGRGGLGLESFDFVFRFRSGDQHVTILFTPGPRRGTVRVCILRR